MAKREVPVFVIDRNRDHGLGEVDFIVCTDIDNGFVAICEYVENVPDEMTDTSITQKGGGVDPRLSLRITIKRSIGKNPTPSATRTLLRKAMKVYTTDAYVSVKEDSTVEDCIRFLDIMIKSNKHHMQECGVDYEARQTLLSSLFMLEKTKGYLDKIK